MYSSLPGEPRKTSLLLEAQLHPFVTAAVLAGVAAARRGAVPAAPDGRPAPRRRRPSARPRATSPRMSARRQRSRQATLRSGPCKPARVPRGPAAAKALTRSRKGTGRATIRPLPFKSDKMAAARHVSQRNGCRLASPHESDSIPRPHPRPRRRRLCRSLRTRARSTRSPCRRSPIRTIRSWPRRSCSDAATSPADLRSRSIGGYARGCVAGAAAIPIDGDTWQVMRLSRNRNWGHPQLIALPAAVRHAASVRSTAGRAFSSATSRSRAAGRCSRATPRTRSASMRTSG